MSVLLNSGDQLMGELAAQERGAAAVDDPHRQWPGGTRLCDAPSRSSRSPAMPGSLTDSGRQVLLANRRRRDEWLAVRIAGLDPAEREVLRQAIEILEKVNQA